MSKNNPGLGDQYLNTQNHVVYTLVDAPDRHGEAFATFLDGDRKSLVNVHREELEFVQPALAWPRPGNSNRWLLLNERGGVEIADHFHGRAIAGLEIDKHAAWVEASGHPIEWTE